jgi:hypothetical protein
MVGRYFNFFYSPTETSIVELDEEVSADQVIQHEFSYLGITLTTHNT